MHKTGVSMGISNINNKNSMREVVDFLSEVKRQDVDLKVINEKITRILLEKNNNDIKVFSENFILFSPRILSNVMKKLDSNVIQKIHRVIRERLYNCTPYHTLEVIKNKFNEYENDPDSFQASEILDVMRDSFNKSILNEFIKHKKNTYHVSSLTPKVLEEGDHLKESFTLLPSKCGAYKCGVYTSPYPNLMYTGGDIDKKSLNECLIFAYIPDSSHEFYGVSQDYYLDNIECTSGDNVEVKFQNIKMERLDKTALEGAHAKHMEKCNSINYFLVTSESYQTRIADT
jgi:hypothetical protein